jgi:alpha-galactosidase
MVSVWLDEPHHRLDRMWERLGFRLSEEGPGAAAWATACAPWSLEIAADMRRLCPGALFATLMNPTDVIAGIVHRAGGVRAVGLCVEVNLLRGVLAYHFGVPYDRIELIHAGVNHDGWVLDLRVDGQDGYRLWQEHWGEIEHDADYHPGTRGIRPITELTGHLRSSAYHNWPYQIEQTPKEAAMWQSWRGKREMHLAALKQALRSHEPIVDPPNIHPERSRVNYPWTGVTVGRLMEAIATGQGRVIPLQIANQGAIANFPADAIVEVPSLVQVGTIQPLPVGKLPEWLGGYTRLQAIQRSLIVEYVLTGELAILRRAMATLPMFGTVQQLNRFAEAVHAEFGPDL